MFRSGLPLAVVLGCADVSSLRWTVVFDNEELRERASVVEVAILRGGCESEDVVWTKSYTRAVTPRREGRVPRGLTGLRARAIDAQCVVYAEACESVTVPTREAVRVVMRETAVFGGPCVEDADANVPEASADAGMDGVVCVASEETCNGADDDCDSFVDEGFDFGSPESCGGCTTVCRAPTPFCSGGACASSCAEGEVLCGASCVDKRSDWFHCGDCFRDCGRENAWTICVDGGCVFDGCQRNYADCDADLDTGCETTLRTTGNCTTCGDACSAGQTCCSDGCAELSTDENCAACGDLCGSSETCVGGVCECVPDCATRSCGDDRCGGSCGECGAGDLCSLRGTCCAADQAATTGCALRADQTGDGCINAFDLLGPSDIDGDGDMDSCDERRGECVYSHVHEPRCCTDPVGFCGDTCVEEAVQVACGDDFNPPACGSPPSCD